MYAQDVKWSKELPDNNKYPYLKILGEGPTGFLLLRSNITFDNSRDSYGLRSRRFWLQRFTSEMNLQWEGEITPQVPDSKVLDVRACGDRALIVSYNAHEGGPGLDFYAQYLTAQGRFEGIPVFLENYPFTKIDDDFKPVVTFSKDRSKWSLTYRKPNASGDAQMLCTLVSDTALNPLYRAELSIPAPVKRYVPAHYLLTNAGAAYILGVQYLTDKRVKAPEESYFTISGYDPATSQSSSYDIKLQDQFLSDANMAYDELNELVVVSGFYSTSGMLASAGVFYTALKTDSLKLSSVYTAPFTGELLQKSINDRNDFRKKEVYNYYIDRLLLRKDGGAAVIAESYVETSRTFWDYYTQSMITHNYYRYGNILAASFNPEGGILWNTVFQKEQNSVDDEGFESSYCNLITSGVFYTIYNKYIDQRSSVLISKVDGKGAQKTDVLFQDAERVVIIAKAARQVSDKSMLIPARRQNRWFILRLTFP
jgi:hypothetical protein